MTENNTETETAEETTTPENTADVAALRREAAGYRTKLREAQAALETANTRLAAMQRSEIERLASTKGEDFTPLADGADLWHSTDGLDDFLSDDGTVDADAVRERVAAIGEDRPHYLARETTAGGAADQGRGAPREAEAPPSFGEALKSA